jgi:hypothetical protein
MTLYKNELTGPRVFVVLGGEKEKIHLTGGHAKPEKKLSMCGRDLASKIIVDARDIAPREGYQKSSMWCKQCLGLLENEGLDQKVLFTSIQFKSGTFGDLCVIPHLGREKQFKKYPLNLTPVLEKSEWRVFERD